MNNSYNIPAYMEGPRKKAQEELSAYTARRTCKTS